MTKPDCLLARVLTGKYCRNTSFLECEAPSSCSHGWRGILHGRDLLKTNLGKALGNGLTTKVWQDSWISTSEMLLPYGPVKDDVKDLRVSDLLTTDLTWNTKRIEEILPQFSTKILALRPSQQGAEDVYIWHPAPSGSYSTKSGYISSIACKEFTQERSMSSGENKFDWYKEVWSGPYSPKIKVFIWSILHQAIPVGEALQRRGVTTESKCIRCGEVETINHIFFTCFFAQQTWQSLLTLPAVHLAAATSFKEALIQFRNIVCLPPYGITSNILPWMCWTLWTARNQLIFENKSPSQRETTTKALKTAREWAQAQEGLTKQHQQPITKLIPHRRQELDISDLTVCFTDAAWDKASNKAGLAWTFNQQATSMTHEGSKVSDHVSSALMAEALAIREALQSAISLDITRIKINSDNQTLIRVITAR